MAKTASSLNQQKHRGEARGMNPSILPASISLKPTFLNPTPNTKHLSSRPPRNHRRLLTALSATGGDGKTNEAAAGDPQPPVPLTIRYRPRSRNQRRRGDEAGGEGRRPAAPKKGWEAMTVAEKAMELYVGEKGLLFWLNKFAYASIFIIIGGWILFRFVGPNLGLYQLDTPPLAPSAVFKG